MFEDLLIEMKKIENQSKVSIDFILDDNRFFDRRCPADNCHSEFKVYFEDWKNKVSQEKAYCPVCRNEAPATEWNTEEQSEYIKSYALRFMGEKVSEALRQGVKKANSRRQKGFVKFSLSCETNELPIVIPPEAAEALRINYVCDNCGCKYSIVGSGYFCPACRHESVERNFYESISNISSLLIEVPKFRESLVTAFDSMTVEKMIQTMMEDAMIRIVSSFQCFAELLFEKVPGADSVKRRKNVFQNIHESSELWKKVIEHGYQEILGSDFAELNTYFQQRHLFAHRNGIVDEEYIKKTGDSKYSLGQRIVLKPDNVLKFINLIIKLSNSLETIVKVA